VPVVLGPMLPDALQVMLQKAQSMNARFYQADASLLHLFRNCPLTGLYQQQNFQTVGKTIEVLRDGGFVLPDAQVQSGIEQVIDQTGLLGRWQILGTDPLVVADVAHNEDGVRWVVQQLSRQSFNRLHVVLGMVADKDVSLVLKLLPTHAQYYFCKANIPRGLDAEQLLQSAAQYSLMGNAYASVPMAFEAARQAAQHDDMIFVGGSVFTVAEVL
jgi:dihydrofolate synthase/folylpolyglutamate synthase